MNPESFFKLAEFTSIGDATWQPHYLLSTFIYLYLLSVQFSDSNVANLLGNGYLQFITPMETL